MLHDVTWPALRNCAFARWSPRIGDPSVIGWLTVVVYALTAVLCLGPALQRARARRVRVFWALLALLLAFLAVNKQLDLQSLLTALGRCTAKLQGWYDARRAVQLRVILGLLAAVAAGMSFCAWLLRRHLRELCAALVGLGLVIAFVDVRAVGFHHVDAFIGVSVAHMRMNWLLELTGPCLIACNALAALAAPQGASPPRRPRARR